MQLIPHGVYIKYKNIKTKEGYTLDDVIQSGIDHPNSPYSLIAPSQDAYIKYSEIFENYLKFNYSEDLKKPFENESYSMIKSLIPGMDEIIKEFITEVDITSHRNLDNYSFSSKIKRGERLEVKDKIKNTIKNLEKEIFTIEGVFKQIKNDEHMKRNFEEFFKDSGTYRDWPDNRLIYLNDYSSFICIINEEDHLKIKLNTTNPLEMQHAILNYFEFLEKIESTLDLSMHKNYGFLNTLPSNSGTGSYFRIKVKITSDDKKNQILLNKFEESKKDLLLEIKKEEWQSYLIISNTNPFYTFSTILVEIIGVK
jgi:creatine kinase